MTIFLIPNLNKARAAQVTDHAVRFLLDAGAQVLLPEKAAELLERPHLAARDGYSRGDVVLTVGGDGTILHAARAGLNWHKPILGINLGRTGFLATCEVEEMPEKLRLLAEGRYTLDPRGLLLARSANDWQAEAINDVVLFGRTRMHPMDYKVYCDGCFVSSYRSDGLILATPTGSTAYSMSAGGPIVEPASHSIIVTPVCPHQLAARSMVLSDSRVVTIQHPRGNRKQSYLSVDGGKALRLAGGERVEIRRSDYAAKLVRVTDRSFYQIINQKLGGCAP